MTNTLKSAAVAMGRKGGRSRSPAKIASSRRNAALATAARIRARKRKAKAA